MILVVGDPNDAGHVRPVVAELRRRGARVFVLDLAEIPQRARVSVYFERFLEGFETEGLRLNGSVERAEGGSFRLDEIETIWLRRVSTPDPPAIRDRGFAVAEANHLLVGLAHALRDRRWVNPFSALSIDQGYGKLRQLQVARAVGLEVPRTLMTNDPERAREFVASCKGGAIYKAFACPTGLWTTDAAVALERSSFASVAVAPCIFQEKIEKRSDLRFTVMGDLVLACEIQSQGVEESKLDYRTRCFKLPRARHVLPKDVAEKLMALHRSLGLVFGTGDMILRPDGGYTFLEVNQQGCWLDVAAVEGEDLLGAFCDFLQKE